MLKFLQRIGKSLMLPIACLPIAGLMLRLGQTDVIEALGFIPGVDAILPFFAAAGSALFDNLPLLFAIGVAVGLSDDQNGASGLAGAISYLTLTNVSQQYWVQNYAPEVVETLNISFLGGILAGGIAGLTYNRFRNTKLPEFLAFFGGRRSVPIMTGLISFVVAIPLAMVWPTIQSLLGDASAQIAGMGALGVAGFMFFNRLLIPMGLHHVLNSFFWFQLGEFEGTTGDLNRFFAGDPTAGHFMAGFFPVMMFGLPAVALAIYFAAKKDRRKAVGGMLASLALTAFLTGVTEPIEFLFIFLSPVLLILHALLSAVSGFIGLVIGVLYFVIFYWAIVKFNLPTPGREEEEEGEFTENNAISGDYNALAKQYIELLGGIENLSKVDNCATRLRLEVRDAGLVNDKGLKSIGARGVVHLNKTNVQVIVGTNVEFIADAMKALLK